MFAIAARELRSLFVSPLAWVVLAVFQVLLAWLFLLRVEEFLTLQSRLSALEGAPGITDLVVAPHLESAAVVAMLLMPLLWMRLLAEEQRQGTLVLLFSAPIGLARIVLGKYLALLAVLGLLRLLALLMPLSLLLGGGLDLGKLAAGTLGLLLTLGALGAATLFAGSLTAQPAAAAGAAYGLLLFLWLARLAGSGEANLLAWVSPAQHLAPLLQGLVRSADLGYFVLVILGFLALTIRRLDGLRREG
jgi:ABC-2 type transport system permease protein